MKIADLFYKKGKGKTQYIGSLWEGKFADEQREEGKVPWLDLNLSIVDAKGKRIYATAIEYGSKRLALGKEAGVYPKVGLVKGLDFGEVETDDFEDVVPTEDDGAEDVPDAEETELDLNEVA